MNLIAWEMRRLGGCTLSARGGLSEATFMHTNCMTSSHNYTLQVCSVDALRLVVWVVFHWVVLHMPVDSLGHFGP